MAVSWNLPHISYAATDESLGNKREFSVLTRLSYTLDAFARFYIKIFNVSWCHMMSLHYTHINAYMDFPLYRLNEFILNSKDVEN